MVPVWEVWHAPHGGLVGLIILPQMPHSTPPAAPASKGMIALLIVAGMLCVAAVVWFILSGREGAPPETLPEAAAKPKPLAAAVQRKATNPSLAAEDATPRTAPRTAANPTAAQAGTPLLANTWTWQFDGVEPRTLKFLADGTLLQTRFTGTYEVQGGTQVLVRKSGEAQPAVLNFRADWSGFAGLDFDGKRVIRGERIPPVARFDSPWSLAGAARQEAFKAVLCGTEWTWERLGAATQPFYFDPGGEVRHRDFAATWTIGEEDAVILEMRGGQTAVLALDPNLAGWQGTDFDGKRLVWGRAVRAVSEKSPAAPSSAGEL